MTLIDETLTQTATTAESADILPRRGSKLQRAKMPIAADVVEAAAISHGVCIRPVTMKATNQDTGEVAFIDVPCGATLESKCPPCAERARRLRVHQCREGWHLDTEPDLTPDQPTTDQVGLAVVRADITAARDHAIEAGDELEATAHSESIADVDGDLMRAGVRGDIDPPAKERRNRSTRRRDDAPDLPKREATGSTIGRVYEAPDGQVFRPSMFLTLTLPSYGHVHREDGTPVDPGSYDYVRAARDAIGFSALVDRFMQNLRRVAGYDVQYFAAVEPQRRLAAHVHFAIRGSIPRKVIRQVVAATYRQIWWPTPGTPVYTPEQPPVWAEYADGRTYADPATGAELTTWDEALDQLDQVDDLAQLGIGDGAQPFHVLKFGTQIDLQGLLAGSADSDRRVLYIAKYLTKSMTAAHTPDDDDPTAWRQQAHADRLHAALQMEPCSPTCANWLRYGIQPKNAHAGMAPGSCRSKAHKREHLGYAGRRILVSRKWTGKTLADHKYDRRAWVLATLGVTSDDSAPGAGRAHLPPEPEVKDPSGEHEAAHQLLKEHVASDTKDEASKTAHDQNKSAHEQDSQRNVGLGPPLHGSDPSRAAEKRLPTDKTRDQWRWEPAARDDPIGSPQHRLLRAIADRQRWRAEYEAARDGTTAAAQQLSATSIDSDSDHEETAA